MSDLSIKHRKSLVTCYSYVIVHHCSPLLPPLLIIVALNYNLLYLLQVCIVCILFSAQPLDFQFLCQEKQALETKLVNILLSR